MNSTTSAASFTVASASTHVAHDASGNMTRVPKPSSWSSHFHLVYDAWNRLVTVKDADDSTLVAEYQYDGRNFRIVKKTYDSGTLDETRHYYYNRNWQCLEERVGTSSTADRQYVWGMRYIDDLILRDDGTEVLYSLADPNWNVAAILSASGSVQERYRYDAYGTCEVQTAGFAARTTSSYDWEYSFTTRRLDAETGCMYYRNRYYHPTLGRFQKRDPIGYEGGMNLFNRSMILSAVDPYGLSDWVWPWDPDAEWVWPWDPNASWDLQDTFDTWFYGICQMLDEFANNLPNLNDLITCGCFIFAIADSVLTPIANPVVEYTDCGCNAISAVQTGCSQGVYNGLGYLATTFSDCFSLAVGGSVGGAIGGVFGGKPGAATGAVIGDIANEIAMFGLQNYLSQGTVLPADQIQACCRLLAGGAGAIAEVLQSIVDLVMEFLHEINRIVDDIEHGKLPPLF